jgi:streptogramin lyase
MVPVIERMAGYPPLAFPLVPQRTPAPRIGGGAVQAERQQQARRRQADYLSSLNLSAGRAGATNSRRSRGRRATRHGVIYTEYDLPRRTRQPHDVIVDSTGMVWYASFGEQILGKLDPRTSKVTDYEIPLLKPGAPDRHPRHAVRSRRESVAGDAVSGRHRQVRQEDREVPDLEPAAGA